MKNRKATSKVTIEIYDEDGVLAESIGGDMDFGDVRSQMIDVLKNDGIPVIRRHGKHEHQEDAEQAPCMGLHSSHAPVTVSIRTDEISFSATGCLGDVLEAQELFLESLLDE